MRLIAIANISDGKETIGFRLLDIDTKQTKDVPLSNVKKVIESGKVQIENLTVKDGEMAGSNGSIDRLPKIINKQLIGKSPLIVLDQLEDQGYTVSDFKGNIKKVRPLDLLKYAKEQGISNGKIGNKDGKEFISSIRGLYKVTKLQNKNNKELTKPERIIGIRERFETYKLKSKSDIGNTNNCSEYLLELIMDNNIPPDELVRAYWNYLDKSDEDAADIWLEVYKFENDIYRRDEKYTAEIIAKMLLFNKEYTINNNRTGYEWNCNWAMEKINKYDAIGREICKRVAYEQFKLGSSGSAQVILDIENLFEMIDEKHNVIRLALGKTDLWKLAKDDVIAGEALINFINNCVEKDEEQIAQEEEEERYYQERKEIREKREREDEEDEED